MNEASLFADVPLEPVEFQFAKVLENYQLSGNALNPFHVIQNFLSISASRALAAQREVQGGHATVQEFESWDLETKLWHLVHILYSYRLSPGPTDTEVPLFVSYSFKREAFLNKNPKVKELLLILQWLQQNSDDVDVPQEPVDELKWNSTKMAIETKDLASLTSKSQPDLVDQLDMDAPSRSNKQITEEDVRKDATNFVVIYDLLLAGKNQEAIDYAAQTGNYTLCIILIGAFQDYIDPVIDGVNAGMDVDDDESVFVNGPSGIKHKYLWYETVYQLAQDPTISKAESLIYLFLCGADLSENIKYSSTWESHVLLYVNQLLTHHLRTLLKTSLTEEGNSDEIISKTTFPSPQHQAVDGILNTLLNTSAIAADSKNPFRVIMGSIIIDQLLLFLHNSFKSSDSKLIEDQHILRVLAHLAVSSLMLGLDGGSKTPTKIITKYISKLSESGLDDLVPVYLSFIPDERDVRECYSIFLTTIMDSEKRNRQLEILRRLGISVFNESSTPFSSTTDDADGQYESKIHNVLKRTVERVMLETQKHYEPLPDVQLKAESIDDVDIKLSRSVEWLYENYMYEDAIIATRTIFQRFLQTGRLKAIKEFAAGKDFKKLLKNYDSSVQIKSIEGTSSPATISETEKEELLQYDQYGQCLNYLDEWHQFINSKSDSYWMSKDVEKSIEKITLNLRKFIANWLQNAILQCNDEFRVQMYKEMRSLYVPYVVIELLQVLQQCRLYDWKYMDQAFSLVNEVANDRDNDFLQCFLSCGRTGEFVSLAGDIAMMALEKGNKEIFA